MKNDGSAKLDALDKKIMYELDLNARIPAAQLARKLRKSKETVNFRINRLLRENYLTGFYGIFNTSRLGWYYSKMYIRFKGITPEKEQEIIEYIQKQSHISFLASIEGYYNLIVLVMVKQPDDVAVFLNPFMKLYGEYIQVKDATTFITAHRLNQKFFTPEAKTNDICYQKQIEAYDSGAQDKQLLELLSENARMPLTEMAKKMVIDPKAVKYRMKKLEKDRIILGYVSSPNFSKLGLQFIQINISFNDPTVIPSVLEYFDSTSKCLFFMEMLGKYDVAVEVHVKDNMELKEILDGFRKLFANYYTSYDVITIIKQYKMIWNPFK
jgi:DNA-binding Lrp family transcriptional regulator